MCGRFSLFTDIETLQQEFDFANLNELKPRYNIAPGQNILTVINDGQENRAGFLRWGLIPFFAKDEKYGNYTKNARAETVDSKRSYQVYFKQKRCIILASGFFEWNKFSDRGEPFNVHLRSKAPMAFAGLWAEWKKSVMKKSILVRSLRPDPMK